MTRSISSASASRPWARSQRGDSGMLCRIAMTTRASTAPMASIQRHALPPEPMRMTPAMYAVKAPSCHMSDMKMMSRPRRCGELNSAVTEELIG